jgi:hypothetical protein
MKITVGTMNNFGGAKRRSEMNHQQKLHLKDSLDKADRVGIYNLTTKKQTEALQFRTKKEAISFAKLVGWNLTDVIRRDIMGFLVWVISDPHLNLLTARGALRCLLQKGINPELETTLVVPGGENG